MYSAEGTQVSIRARDFTWLGDEPTGAGGTDTGPTPYEILLGSLAACITITLRLYADHKGIPLEEVHVRLEYDRVHADDCVGCDERADGWIERIQSHVTLRGTFDGAPAQAVDAGGGALSRSQDAGERSPHR